MGAEGAGLMERAGQGGVDLGGVPQVPTISVRPPVTFPYRDPQAATQDPCGSPGLASPSPRGPGHSGSLSRLINPLRVFYHCRAFRPAPLGQDGVSAR